MRSGEFHRAVLGRGRNPDPRESSNAFKEEHYRRIAYANQHFDAGIPGWMTDRGRIYILHGPPDTKESRPSGGNYNYNITEGSGNTTGISVRTLVVSAYRRHR